MLKFSPENLPNAFRPGRGEDRRYYAVQIFKFCFFNYLYYNEAQKIKVRLI